MTEISPERRSRMAGSLAVLGGATVAGFGVIAGAAWLLGPAGPAWLRLFPPEVALPTTLGCFLAGLLVCRGGVDRLDVRSGARGRPDAGPGEGAGDREPAKGWGRPDVLAALLLLAINLVLLVGGLLTHGTMLDDWIARLPGSAATAAPSRTAPFTALSLLLVGGALLLRSATGMVARLRVLLLVAALLAASLGLLGYAYGVEGTRHGGRFHTMSLPVSAALALLSISALALESEGGWGMLFSNGGRIARTSRRQVLLSVVVPFVAGLAVLPLLREHRITPGMALAAMAASIILPLAAQSLRDGERLEELARDLERRVAERTASLVSSQARLSTYFDNAPEGMVLIRVANGELLFEAASPSFRRMYALGDRALEGLPVLSFMFAADGAVLSERIHACLRTGTPIRYAVRRRFDDEIRAFDVLFAPVPADAGHGDRLVAGSIRDITESERREEQLRQSQKMEAVGQLTGGIAHDFNNLLTGITGSLELIAVRLRQNRPEAVARHIATAQEAAERAAALTHRLLAFSRRQTLDPHVVALPAVVDGMMPLIRRSVGPAVTLAVAPEAADLCTLVDPNQLENALLNLCLNAADAMPDGGSLLIRCEALASPDDAPSGGGAARAPELAPGAYVALRVTDNGVGMTADVIRHAFEPFFTTKPIGQGTGLGLSMIYGFARQSGGDVSIESVPGRGTTVSLFLPRHREARAVDEPDRSRGATTTLPFVSAARILVVDDEDAVRDLVAEALRDAGHAVETAPEAGPALDWLRAGDPFDLLVTDVGLPGGMNGRQLAEAARLLQPRLPVLFITGYAEDAAFRGRLADGMTVLTKPFGLDALLDRVRERLAAAGSGPGPGGGAQSAASAAGTAARRDERSDASSM